MSPVVFGNVKDLNILYEITSFENYEEIAKLIQARCRTFLMNKYSEIT